MNVYVYRTQKTATGFTWEILQHEEKRSVVIKSGTRATRAQATHTGKKWLRYFRRSAT